MPAWDQPQQMVGVVSAVSGTACMVTVLGSDNTASVPVGQTVAVGDSVVLFSVKDMWYVNAVLPPTDGSQS